MKKSFIKIISLVLTVMFVLSLSPISALAAEKTDNPPTTIEQLKGKATTSTTTAPKKTAEPTMSMLGFRSEDIAALYKGFSGKFMVSPIPDNSGFVSNINSIETAKIPEVKVDADKAATSIEASFLVVFKNGIRRVYALVGNNILQAGDKFYQIPATTYDNLKNLYKADTKRASYAQWLIYMKPAKVTGITYEVGGEKVRLDTASVAEAVQLIRAIRVTSGESYSPKLADFKPGNGNVRITIEFGETTYYQIMVTGSTMFIESDEMHIGTKHTIVSADVKALLNHLQGVEPQ